MRKLLPFVLLSLIFMSFSFVSIAKEESPEIKECLKVYNECNQLKKDPNINKTIYVRDYGTNDFGKWQIYDKSKEGYWISEIDLFYRNDKLRLISYFETDPGGDTAQYLDYYFRIDGTTAYVEEDYRILAGYDSRTVTKVYMNSKGKIIDHSIKVYDLHSKQEKKEEKNLKDQLPEISKNSKDLLIRYKVPF